MFTLERYAYAPTYTAGRLCLGDEASLDTLERPWKPGLPGGMPFESCVPDGEYRLLRHARPNGDVVLALRNPNLGVYYSKASIPAEGGRYLILIHAANYVEQVQGCIAPGCGQTITDNRMMVTSSRRAMAQLMDYYERTGASTLVIKPCLGSK